MVNCTKVAIKVFKYFILQQFEEFIRSEAPHQRLRAIQFSETLFSSFLSLNFDKQVSCIFSYPALIK